MLRLAHLADIHPNSHATFAGKMVMDPATGKNMSLTDLQRSLEFVYNQTTQVPGQECDLAVIPGDLFDSTKPTMDEVRVIVEWIDAMTDSMMVVIIPGNHDMAVSPNMATAMEPLRHRQDVFVMERPDSILLKLRSGGQLLRVFGLPYPMKARLLQQDGFDQTSPEELTAHINFLLAGILRGFHAQQESDAFNLLLAHGSVSQCKVGDQPRSLAHDILIPLDELHGFDYAALGHIHQRQQVAPNAWYSGSLMRNGFGEEHEPKGFNLVELERGQLPHVTFIDNPHARRYQTIGRQDLSTDPRFTPLGTTTVWRFKDQLSEDEYQALKPGLQTLQDSTPFLQMDVEIVKADRSRDAGMSQCLTMDQALERILSNNHSAHEITALMECHRALMSEVTT